jgi:hypothetical protein
MLESSSQILSRMGDANAAWAKVRAQTPSAPPVLGAAVSQTVGTVNKLYVRRFNSSTCAGADSIGGRTVAIGQHIIVVADTTSTWTAAFRPDSAFYQTFANEYDNITYPHLLANIGDPMSYDAQLANHTGKVMAIFTPLLNNLPASAGGGSIVAFVNPCDFFPYQANATLSNQAEAFYSWVPASNGYDVTNWELFLRGTAAHESKHIVSISLRVKNNSPSEEVWLEEGLAQVSSEIWERNFNKATWKGGANFVQTIACELNLGPNAPCDASGTLPLTLTASHLPFLFTYLQGEATNSQGLGLSDTNANYGDGWAIARWITDQYAGAAEAPFIKALIAEPSLTGLANLAAHSGTSVQSILVYFNMATAFYQPAPNPSSDVRMTIPSFNLADIFNIGQTALTCANGARCGIFTDSGLPVDPLSPAVLTTGAIAKSVLSVPGTATSFFLLTASANGIENLQLLTTGGTALLAGSGLRVAILRVQ